MKEIVVTVEVVGVKKPDEGIVVTWPDTPPVETEYPVTLSIEFEVEKELTQDTTTLDPRTLATTEVGAEGADVQAAREQS